MLGEPYPRKAARFSGMVSERRVVSLCGTFFVRLNRAHDALGILGMVPRESGASN